MNLVHKLGPEGYRNIAIVGSAPSSVRLAPYKDESWAVWGCSPGVFGVAPRTDVWFEMHRWEAPVLGDPMNPGNKPWFSPEYCRWIEIYPGVVYLDGPSADVANPVPAVRNGARFPKEDYIAKYGPYFFTSSVAWMLAHAIEQLAPRVAAGESCSIGLWGIDMAAHTEYAFQRPGCQHFIGLAKKLGIGIVLPLESDLMQPSTMYGNEYHPRNAKLLIRLHEMQSREQALAGQIGALNTEIMCIRGAIDNQKYILSTWVDDIDPGMDITSAVSLAGVVTSRPEPQVAALEKFADAGGEAMAEAAKPAEVTDAETLKFGEYKALPTIEEIITVRDKLQMQPVPLAVFPSDAAAIDAIEKFCGGGSFATATTRIVKRKPARKKAARKK